MTRSSFFAAIAVAVVMSTVAAVPANAQACASAPILGGPADRSSEFEGPVTFSWAPSDLKNAVHTLHVGRLGEPKPQDCKGNPCTLPLPPGDYEWFVSASDGRCTVSSARPFNLRVQACPAITLKPASGSAIVGKAFGDEVGASGGAPPYTYTAPILPPGLTFSAGKLSGTPTREGNFTIPITATDANGCSGSVSYALRVSCPTMAIAPASLGSAAIGTQFSAALTTDGGTAPYSYAASGLPSWLSLSGATLTGTPTAPGTFNFNVMSTDANGCAVQKVYSIVVPCPTIKVESSKLSNGTIGVPYPKAGFIASGGAPPYTYAVVKDVLPPGLVLEGDTLTGTPTREGTFQFTIGGKDANGCQGSATFAIVVVCPAITISPAAVPKATRDQPYSVGFAASGGTGPYLFALTGNLPPGVTFSGDKLTGTPTAIGQFTFTITTRDANGCGTSATYVLSVDPPACPALTLLPNSLPDATVGTSYKIGFEASGGAAPYSYNMVGEIPGLSFVVDTLGGVPKQEGKFNVTIGASDANRCTGVRSYTLAIGSPSCPTVTISPDALPAGIVGSAYRATFAAAGGTAPYSYNATGVPAGLAFSGDTLSGAPLNAGTFTLTITAADARQCTSSRPYSLLVNPPACQTDKTELISPRNREEVRLPVGLNWTAVKGAVGYKVFALLPRAVTPSQLGATTATSLSLSSLPQGEIEWWVVTEFEKCPSTESAHNVFIVAASAFCSTEAPVAEAPANGATGVENPVKFGWSAVKNALKYNIYASLNGGASSNIGSSTGTTFETMVPEGTIDWIVEAIFEGCPATRSATSRFTTVRTPICPTNPDVPALISPANDAKVDSPVTVSWTAARNATSYKIHGSLNGNAPSVIGTTTATELQIPLPAGAIKIQVEAVFSDNCPSTFSKQVTFTVSGGAACSNSPTTLVAPANSAEAQSPVTFSWTAVPRSATHRVFVSSNGSSFELLAETRETTISRLIPPGSYAWLVETTFLGCESVKSATFRFTVTDPKKCAEGSITLVSPASGTSATSPVAFSWSAVTSALSYRLWVAIDGGAPSVVFKGTETSATVSIPSGTVEWYVDAQLLDCPSIVSPTSKFTVQRATTCDNNQRPTLLSPLTGSVTNPVVLQWTASANAVGYRVWLSVNGAPYADLGTTRETSLTRELLPGSSTWYVEAIFENCPAIESTNKGGFTIADQTPRCATEAPSTISPADGATTVASPVTLVWTAVLNAAGYRVYASKGGEFFLIGETSDTSLTSPMPPGNYVWFVEAVFKGCTSTTSMKVRFTIPASTNCGTDKPQTISPRDGEEALTSPVKFAWSPISGASRYALIARGENGSPTVIAETTDTSLTVPMPPVAIEWWVVAFRVACDSVESNHSTFKVVAPNTCDAKAPALLGPLDGATDVTPPTQFAWTSSARGRAYKLWVAAGSSPFSLVTTTSDTRASAPIPPGSVSWYVEAVFDDCPPLQSATGNFSVGQAVTVCRTPDAPPISLAGQVLSGTQFTVRWGAVGNISAYELQESNVPNDFAGATTTIVNDTFVRFTYTAAGTPIQKFYRVRAVSACSEERGAYSNVIGIFIVPTNTIETQTRGTVEQGVSNTPVQTLFLPASPTPITFTARTDRPWLHVSPTNGTLGLERTPLSITADHDFLAVGANSGTVIIEYGAGGKGALQAGNPPPGTVPVSVSLVTPVGAGGKNTPPPDSLIIPAVAHAQGANNSLFQSDVRVANTSTQTMKYLLNFTPSGVDGTVSGSSTQIQIEPGATAALDDILASFFGSGTTGSASGVLEIRPLSATTSSTSLTSSGSSLATATVASSRTYNVTSTGTFGQFIPAVAFSKFIGKPTDGSRAILSLQQIAQSAAYRTNLGLVEAAGEPADVRVTVFDKSNAVVAEIPISLKAAEHKQLNSFLAANNVALEDGRFEIEVTSSTGKVTAYASTIDNVSGDPLLVSPVLKSAVNGTRYVIPGVASIDGLAKWRTDVRLYNTSSSSVNTTLTFFPQGNAAPQTSSITLNPGETRALDNVLRNQFGLTEANVGGSVLVTTQSESSIVATARTYAETSGGTYGQFIPAVTPDEGVALGGRSLHLIQLEQSAAYRTNVGLVETTGQDVTAEVTLILPDSKLTPKVPITLPANGFVQFPLSAFNVGNAVYNARISIKVTSGRGRVSAYGSVIDNRTSDPTYVPAQ